ncbi:MAG TPA: PQQ-binding-like beta-propeller repeat protein [bacterium]|nr:PQQ-binding-like beta-propeller repeat protein [bacterium]
MKRLLFLWMSLFSFVFLSNVLANDDDTGPPPDVYQTVWHYDTDGGLLDEFNLTSFTGPNAFALVDDNHVYALNKNTYLRYITESTRQIEWEVRTASSMRDWTLDGNGNFIFAGYTSYKCAVLKYDRTGARSWAWEDEPPLNGRCELQAVAVDGQNNVVAVGEIDRAVGPLQILLVKLNASGNELWRKVIAVNHQVDDAGRLAVDGQGRITFSGYTGLNQFQMPCLHVFRFAADGQELWHTPYAETDYLNYAEQLLVDEQGNTILFTGRSYLGQTKYPPYGFLGIVKLDAQGQVLWTGKHNQFKDCRYLFMAQDAQQNIIAAGLSFSHITSRRIFAIKYTTDGKLQWMTERGNHLKTNDDLLHPFALDAQGNLYAAFGKGDHVVTVKFNQQGELVWDRSYTALGNGSCENYPHSIIADSAGHLQLFSRSVCYEINPDDDDYWDDDYYVDDDTGDDDDTDDDNNDSDEDDNDSDDDDDDDGDDDGDDTDDDNDASDDDDNAAHDDDNDDDDNDGCGGCVISSADPTFPVAGLMMLLGLVALWLRRRTNVGRATIRVR